MRLQLATALLASFAGASAGVAHSQPLENSTAVSSDVLFYSDTDSVVVVSPQVAARTPIDEDGGEVSARFVLDAITAASVDVVSSATPSFSELRTEVDLSVSKSIGEWLPSVGYRYSHEPDYDSHGFTLGTQRELADGDAAIGVTLGTVVDSIGRTDTPRTVFSEQLLSQSGELSFTQTLDAKTLVRVAYSLTGQFGYMEKPYRSVPLFDAAGIDAAMAAGETLSLENFDSFRLGSKPPEEVPDRRFRHAIAARGLRFLPLIDSALRLDYRFYTDSWGIQAHTAESALFRSMTEWLKINAWGRVHWQSSASFWREIYVVNDGEIPAFRSVDRSLSRALHLTGGLRVEASKGALSGYLEGSVMLSKFPAFLFLDTRTALMSQAGVRWRF